MFSTRFYQLKFLTLNNNKTYIQYYFTYSKLTENDRKKSQKSLSNFIFIYKYLFQICIDRLFFLRIPTLNI